MALLMGAMTIRLCALNTAHVDVPGLSIDLGDYDEDEDLISD